MTPATLRPVTALAVLAIPAIACECRHLTACEIVQLPTIFIGEVIEGGITSIRQDPWQTPVNHVRLKVIEIFRGLPANTKTVDMEIQLSPGMCSPNPFYMGHRYLVLPSKRDGKFYEGICFQSRDVGTYSEDLLQVRAFFTGKKEIDLHGRIGVSGRKKELVDSLLNYLLDTGEAPRIAGARFLASRNGKIYHSTTNSNGEYHLILPGPGQYNLRAALAPYTADPEISIPVSQACATHDFRLLTNNTISGRVLDTKYQPIKDAMIGLIDLERNFKDAPLMTTAYAEEAGSIFEFKSVPLGRYLLVFNPEGPKPRSPLGADLPFESTYYPPGSARDKAYKIEVKTDGVHFKGMDLKIGDPVAFRSVKVRVRFPDGAPMTTAEVGCIGISSSKTPVGCNRSSIALESGIVEFQVPTNHEIQLKVSDRYGRKLNGDYTATHPPGASMIAQEFIVTP